MVHARRHDLDPVALGAVEIDELLALVRGRGEHQVGAVDRLLLDPRPPGGIVVDPGVGLHARQRVERRDQRNVELVLQPVPERAGDPVVGVQRVVAQVLGARGGRASPSASGSMRSMSVVLRHRLRRTRRSRWTTRKPGSISTTVGLAGMVATGEHVALDAGARQRGGERPHVDVHPATVARARLRERRRVHAEDGETAQRHSGRILTVGSRGLSSLGPPGQAPTSTVPGCSLSCWNDR